MQACISPRISKWHRSITSWSEIENWSLAYETFRHAEEIFSKAKTKPQLCDVIINLKRCVDSRVRHLDRVYRFKKLPLAAHLDGIYDRMTYVGLLRPVMMGKLYEIRNAIEHRDDPSPHRSRCEELLEFTWYFLRSTDQAAQKCTSDVTLREKPEAEENGGYWLEVSYSDEPKNPPNVRGWLPADWLSESAKPTFFPIEISSKETKAQFQGRSAEGFPQAFSHIADFSPEDVYVSARAVDKRTLQWLYEIYFTVL